MVDGLIGMVINKSAIRVLVTVSRIWTRRSHRRSLVASMHSAEVPYAVCSYTVSIVQTRISFVCVISLLLQPQLPRLPCFLAVLVVSTAKSKTGRQIFETISVTLSPTPWTCWIPPVRDFGSLLLRNLHSPVTPGAIVSRGREVCMDPTLSPSFTLCFLNLSHDLH